MRSAPASSTIATLSASLVKSAERIVFSIDPNGKSFRLTSPDVSCSLAFNGRNSALLIQPVVIEDLPLADLLKLDGPASIQDDMLQLEVQNSTEWELREITVGITLERNSGQNAELAARARVIPAAEPERPFAIEVVDRRSNAPIHAAQRIDDIGHLLQRRLKWCLFRFIIIVFFR